jgi:hypothetical protein
MGFAILRVQKLKSTPAVYRSMKHAFREQDTPNADPERTPDNSHLATSSVDEGLAKFAERMPEKVRKNAVLAVEFFVGGSPEAMAAMTREQQDAYLGDALKWIQDRHGAANVITASIHRDESTPHLSVIAVPLDAKGKLNCRSFYGGADTLTRMQTEFAEKVGKRHGLERGIEGSKARHTTIRDWYAGMAKVEAFQQPEIPAAAVQPKKTGMLAKESPEEVAKRLTAAIHTSYAPIVAAAGTVVSERQKREQAEATAKATNAKLDAVRPLLKALDGLPAADVAEVIKLVQEKRSVRERAAEAARRIAAIAKEAKQATTSAVGRYCRNAWAAITEAGGEAGKVDWKGHDDQWARHAREGRDVAGMTALHPLTVATVLMNYSPQHAGMTPKLRDASLARIKQLTAGMPDPERPDGPKLGR